MNENNLKTALGISVSVIASEHSFSAMLSSPWSVEKFTDSKESADKVWTLFWESSVASLVFAVIIGWILKNIWGVVATIIVIAIYYWVYMEAIKNSPYGKTKGGT